jgi:hypothetical protein
MFEDYATAGVCVRSVNSSAFSFYYDLILAALLIIYSLADQARDAGVGKLGT